MQKPYTFSKRGGEADTKAMQAEFDDKMILALGEGRLIQVSPHKTDGLSSVAEDYYAPSRKLGDPRSLSRLGKWVTQAEAISELPDLQKKYSTTEMGHLALVPPIVEQDSVQESVALPAA
jgi:hypothetical protein